MICSIADDLDLKLGQHGKLLIALWTKYSDVIGYAPDHMFLLGVLRMRNDKRLSPAQRVRSERLLASYLQTAGNNKRCQAIEARSEHLSNVFEALEVDTYNAYLLTCLEEEQSLKSLCQGGRVPEALVEEIRTCKADLEQIVSNLYATARPTS